MIQVGVLKYGCSRHSADSIHSVPAPAVMRRLSRSPTMKQYCCDLATGASSGSWARRLKCHQHHRPKKPRQSRCAACVCRGDQQQFSSYRGVGETKARRHSSRGWPHRQSASKLERLKYLCSRRPRRSRRSASTISVPLRCSGTGAGGLRGDSVHWRVRLRG